MERYVRWRVLVDEDRVAVDPSGSVAALAAETLAGAFPVAPELLLARDEGPTVLDGHAASPESERQALRDAYVGRWRQELPLPATERVMALAAVAERAFQAVTYERLQAAQEDSSRWQLEGVVARCLRRLAEPDAG